MTVMMSDIMMSDMMSDMMCDMMWRMMCLVMLWVMVVYQCHSFYMADRHFQRQANDKVVSQGLRLLRITLPLPYTHWPCWLLLEVWWYAMKYTVASHTSDIHHALLPAAHC